MAGRGGHGGGVLLCGPADGAAAVPGEAGTRVVHRCPLSGWTGLPGLLLQVLRPFLPFSEGPRACVGQSLALVEIRAALVLLLGHFSFQLTPDMGGWEGAQAAACAVGGSSCCQARLQLLCHTGKLAHFLWAGSSQPDWDDPVLLQACQHLPLKPSPCALRTGCGRSCDPANLGDRHWTG